MCRLPRMLRVINFQIAFDIERKNKTRATNTLVTDKLRIRFFIEMDKKQVYVDQVSINTSYYN